MAAVRLMRLSCDGSWVRDGNQKQDLLCSGMLPIAEAPGHTRRQHESRAGACSPDLYSHTKAAALVKCSSAPTGT